MRKLNQRAEVLLWILLACSSSEAPPPTDGPAEQPATAVTKVAKATPIAIRGPGVAKPTSVPLKKSSGAQFAIDTLTKVVVDHCRDPGNPWAIGHGLVAMGSPLELSNGADAVQWLFSQYAERYQSAGSWLVRFPTKRGDIRIEPHTDLLLKAMTDAGVDPAQSVEVQGSAHRVSDLYQSSLGETWIDIDTGKTSFGTPNDTPWSLFALASWADQPTVWTSQSGQESSLDALTDHTMDLLVHETNFIAQAKAKKTGFQKRGQGIFKYTCGGAHLLQGVAHSILRGFGSSASRAKLKDQLHLLLYRFPIELQQIDEGEKKHPAFKLQLRVQRLKLTGHTLETLYRISATEMIGEQDRGALEQVAAEVVKSVVLLQETGAFEQLNKIREAQEQLYLDIVGDSAHTLRALLIATGESPVYY